MHRLGRTAAPLLGRERELAELEAAYVDARAGLGGLVLVAGEAGIGKTHLVEAFAARRETPVVWGRAWEGGGAPAYWPWKEALRTLAAARPVMVASGGASIAQLVPELGLTAPSEGDDPEAARFALFDSVAGFLRESADPEPLVIVLEDLHVADAASIQLLQFVAREVSDAPVLLVGTLREGGEVLLGGAQRMVLHGLDEDAVGRLLERRTGAPPDAGLVGSVHEMTDGNPFFADEIARLLAANPAAGVQLPQSAREAIGRRLAPLEPGTVEALEVASVLGREFGLASLEDTMDPPLARPALLEALDGAVGPGLVEAMPGMPGRFRFGHALIREVLYDRLPPARRMRLHAAAGAALERRGTGPADLPEVAHHLLAAAPVAGAAHAVEVAERAGDWAMSVHAYAQAADLFKGAFAALELAGAEAQERRPALLLSLGRAQLRAGLTGRATLLAVADVARAGGDAELLARTGIDLAGIGLTPGHVDTELVGVLEEAIERLGSDHEALRARAMARLAIALYFAPDAGERIPPLVEEAVGVARRLGDPATVADVLANCQVARWGPDTTEEGLAWAEEILALAEAGGGADPELGVQARNWRTDLLMELGQHAAADAAVDDYVRVTDELAQGRFRWRARAFLARRAILTGQLADAERLNAEALALGVSAGDRMAPLVGAAQAGLIRLVQGRFSEAEGILRHSLDSFPAMAGWRSGLALVLAQTGRADEARAEFERFAGEHFRDLRRDNIFIISLTLGAEACRELGDSERAAEISELLEPFAERNIVSPAAAFLGPVARPLGILAAVRGDLDAARRWFAEARTRAERMGARPVLAHLALDEARALADAGESVPALELAERAAALAEELALDGLAAAALRLREQLSDSRSAPEAPVESTTGELTREGDVWSVRLGARVVRVRDAKGVRHLAQLLANPGVEIHSLDLAAGEGGLGPAGAAAGDAGAALDPEAKAAYRARLEDLRDEIEEAENFNDAERAARAREEMQFLAAELAGAMGLGGRDRRMASDAERARINVTRAIRTVLRRVADHDQLLARELETTVHTGTFCAYRPDPRRPVRWRVEG